MLIPKIRQKLFKEAAFYFPLLEEVLPRAMQHRYSFVEDKWFQDAAKSQAIGIAEINYFIVLDLLEKSHLSSVTALIRLQRWADAICLMHGSANYLGFAAAYRGLLESGGDAVDGLLNIAVSLATHRGNFSLALSKQADSALVDCSEIERPLDHYIHAGWTGKKSQGDSTFTAKANVEYIRQIEKTLPQTVSLYHRLCAIVHPSNASIDWLFEFDSEGHRYTTLASNDAAKIAGLCNEFPEAASVTFQMACNSALLVLRVLHAFPLHPRIPELRKLDWSKVPAAREVERYLRK